MIYINREKEKKKTKERSEYFEREPAGEWSEKEEEEKRGENKGKRKGVGGNK